MTGFKDLFSIQSGDYKKFRPTYPPELFEYLNALVKKKDLAWDAGTGNGQAAVELAKLFREVIASDPSEKQIAEAPRLPNIVYKTERAEAPSFSQKVDLITVAQAFHWLKHDEFAHACKKVGNPECHLVVWSYALAFITPEIDAAVDPLYNGLLGKYWEPERRDVENGYKNIHMPFEELTPPKLTMKTKWTFERYAGYLTTWSALQKYRRENPETDFTRYFSAIEKAWGEVPERELTWPLNMRVWKIT